MRNLILCCFCLLHQCVFSQLGYQISYNNLNLENTSSKGKSIQIDSDNNILIAASNYNFENLTRSFSLLKTDLIGDIIWTKTYQDLEAEFDLSDATSMGNGEFILVGTSKVSLNNELLIVRLNQDGEMLWSNRYSVNSGGFNRLSDPSILVNNNKILISIHSVSNENSGVLFLEMDDEGAIVWKSKFFVENQSDAGSESRRSNSNILITDDGGYLISESIRGNNTILETNGLLIKTDPKGNLIWGLEFGGDDQDLIRHVIQTNDGGFVAVGHTYSYGAGEADILIVKVDAGGNLLWSKSIGDDMYQSAWSLIEEADGSLLVAGNMGASIFSNSQMILLKLSSIGELEFVKRDIHYSLVQDLEVVDDHILLTGGMDSLYSVGLMRLNIAEPYLCDLEPITLMAEAQEVSFSDLIDSESLQIEQTELVMEVVKNEYNKTLLCGVSTQASPVEINDALSVFPIPTFDFLNFKFKDASFNECRIVIYNVHGQILHHESYQGMDMIQINLDQFGKGIYLYEVIEDRKVLKRGKVVCN